MKSTPALGEFKEKGFIYHIKVSVMAKGSLLHTVAKVDNFTGILSWDTQ